MADQSSAATAPARSAFNCCEEPFRLFFPLGAVLGLLGVSLWPFYYAGVFVEYPSISHARLMTEGFVTCFVFGFLGTAGPRVMSVPHFSGKEILRVLATLLCAIAAHLAARHTLGDGFFVASLVLFMAALAVRFRKRQDSPPPNFVLVGVGLLNGLVGGALVFICGAAGSAPNVYRMGNSLLNVGFPLLPLLGVGPFFLRRLLDLPTDSEEKAIGIHARQAGMAFAVALVIDASLVLEVLTPASYLGWVRCACVVIYLALCLPMRGESILATALRMSFAAVAAGLALLALLPAYRISALHVIFIGGVSVAIFAVATRVVLGHSGNLALVNRRFGWFLVAFALIILAMISRLVADFLPTRNEHLLWGAVCWLVAVAIWGVVVLPYILTAEDEG